MADDIVIAGQSLDKALRELSRQTDLQLMFSNADVQSIDTTGVNGNMSAEDALKQLLAGTSLFYEYSGNNTVVVKQQTAANTGQSRSSDTYKEKQVEEIIVTATKRESNLQDTPASISVLGGEDLVAKNIDDMADYLSYVPSVAYYEIGGGINQIVIRGVGTSRFEQATVSTYFGEVPTTPSIMRGGRSFEFKLVDMGRVEVLRGPQGTLFGSGAMGGTVRNIPNAPNLSEFEGRVELGHNVTAHSDEGASKAVGVLNLPLIEDELALRLVAYDLGEAGYIDYVSTPGAVANALAYGGEVDVRNDVGTASSKGVRANALWEPNEELSVSLLLAVDKHKSEQPLNYTNPNVGVYQWSQLRLPNDGFVQRSAVANLTVEYDFGWSTLTSSTSRYDSHTEEYGSDGSSFGLGASYRIMPNTPRVDGLVQEVRLASTLDGPLQFLTGVYYEDFEQTSEAMFEWFGSPEGQAAIGFLGSAPLFFHNEGQTKLEQKAVFGEVSYEVLPQLELTVGGRWFEYDRSGETTKNFFVVDYPLSPPLASSESDTTFKASATYRPNEDVTFYARWAQGFRVGSPLSPFPEYRRAECDVDNDGLLDTTNVPLDATQLKSDRTQNYEVGGKFVFGNRATLNAAVFRIDWDDIAIRRTEQSELCGGPGNFLSRLTNGGQARIQGIEVESLINVTDQLTLTLGGSWLDTEYLDDSLGTKGERLPQSPKYNLTVGAQYNFHAAGRPAFLRADYGYVGKMKFPPNDLSDSVSYGEFGFRAGVDITDQINFAVYGDNVFDNDAIVLGVGIEVYRLRPRVVGAEISYSF